MRRLLTFVVFVLTSSTALAAGPVGTTSLTYSPGHGTQVEFLRQGGAAYLWYPGNSAVLPGEWKATGQVPAQQMCFKYGPHTYNPVTHVHGAVWECENISQYVSTIVEQQRGDVFGLSRRKAVPFVLPAGRTSLERLEAEAGPNAHPGPIVPLRK